MAKWTKIVTDTPTFTKGRPRIYWRGPFDPVRIMRISSPTVAYVKELSSRERWALVMEPTETPFISMIRLREGTIPCS